MNADRLIRELSPAIDQKCGELSAKRKEKRQARLFAALCVLAVLLPALLVFVGVSLTALIFPLVFMSLSALILSPVLLFGKAADQGGTGYEQI